MIGVANDTGLSQGLQVIDAAAGTEIARLDTGATRLAIWPDKERLYLHGEAEGSAWTDVLEAASLEPLAARLAGHVLPARLLDGQPVLTAHSYAQETTDLALLDGESLDVIHRWTLEGYAQWTPWVGAVAW